MKRLNILWLFVFVFLAVGCGQEEPTPEPTPEPPTATAVPEPTATDLPPTETPEPTETPLPTETPEPSPTPLSAAALIEMGDAQLLQSDWRGAEDAYRQAIESEPDNALAHARLAYLLQFHPQTVDEAVEAAQEAAELAPSDADIVAFLIMALTHADQYEEALTHAERIEPLAFNNPFAMSVIAELYLAVGDYDGADRAIGVALVISGLSFGIEELEINRIIAIHGFLTGDRPTAIQYSNRLLNDAPQFAPVYLVRTQILTGDSLRGDSPRELVVEGLTLDSDYLPLMVQLAQIDAQNGNFELALDSCEDVIRLFPDMPDGLLCQGNALLQQAMYEQAGEAFDQVVEQTAEDYRGYLGRGQAYLGLEDCETAETELMTALEYQPYAAQAYAALGETYMCLGNTAEAETAFQEALALRPFDAAINFGLGNLYLSQSRFDDAGQAFITAITFAPAGNVPSIYYSNLGRTLQSAGHCAVSGSTPESTYYLCAGNALLDNEDYLTAADAFSLALETDDNSVAALEGLVTAYSHERLCDVALSYLAQLSDIQTPNDALVETYDSRCTNLVQPDNFTPNGDPISEEEAVELIETAVSQVEGIEDTFVFFDTIDFGTDLIGERRVLFVQFFTNAERGSAEQNRQLTEVALAAAEGFALANSEPIYMFVQSVTSLTDTPAGFIIPRLGTILWYNGVISTGQYRQIWTNIEDILENTEAGE